MLVEGTVFIGVDYFSVRKDSELYSRLSDIKETIRLFTETMINKSEKFKIALEFEQEVWEGEVVWDFIIAQTAINQEEYLTDSVCRGFLERS